MGRVAESVLELVGDTPLIRLRRLPKAGWATVYGKWEVVNPSGSVKDRIALAMVEAAEKEGRLKPGDTIVEATSGNTGAALAMVAAAKGYHLVLVMPEDVSPEWRKLLSLYGAELVLTPSPEGMGGAKAAAEELSTRNPGYFMPRQFHNPANPQAHRLTTAKEILQDIPRIDAFVAGVGTGGTLTGVGEELKAHNPRALLIAVEPASSPFLSQGRAGEHRLAGLGTDFIPPVLNKKIIDRVIQVSDEEALAIVGRLAREEGLLVGPSSGANVWAALKMAEELGKGKTVVTILPDSGERHLALPF